jgi:hypothetical protein
VVNDPATVEFPSILVALFVAPNVTVPEAVSALEALIAPVKFDVLDAENVPLVINDCATVRVLAVTIPKCCG